VVDKFWKVTAVNGDGTIEVITRTGKTHRLPVNDPNISKAQPLQQLFHRKRFPN